MTAIKERPILFSASMVRAILEGRKTVTRRAVKFPLIDRAVGCELSGNEIGPEEIRNNCPYGVPGQRLWVRETFTIESNRWADDSYSPPHKDGRPTRRYEDDKWDQPHYKATDVEPELWYDDRDSPGCRWKPSIHMPRWASRILLEITDVRVERLQDISRADIRAEGLQCPPEMASDDASPNYRDWFPTAWQELWESINGAGSWTANPWVWCVSFKRVTP